MAIQYTVTSNPDDLDIALIHSVISSTYWAENIPLTTLKKSIDNSLVFGAYTNTGEQVGFARVTTDKATFAYLGDVFVIDAYRQQGISKLLMQAVVERG